jgi:hypothetical protein
MFGRNPFGGPLFKVVWGQSEFFKMGNVWRDKYGTERRGYRQRYLCHGVACWNILRWKPAKQYGTPELWYAQTWDPVSKLFILGEYPWRGRYEVLYALNRREMVNGKLEIIAFPLTHLLIDKLLPLMLAVQRMSEEEKRAAREMVREAELKKENEEVAERMMDALPAWYGPVSFSRQGCHTSLLDKKMAAIQAAWNRLSRNGQRPRFQKGLFQARAPIRLSGKAN